MLAHRVDANTSDRQKAMAADRDVSRKPHWRGVSSLVAIISGFAVRRQPALASARAPCSLSLDSRVEASSTNADLISSTSGSDFSSRLISEFRLSWSAFVFAILGVLDDEDHQKRHDRGARIDDEVPSIRPAKKRAGDGPQDDGQDRQHKRSRAAELLLDPAREAGEARPLQRSIVFVMLAYRRRDDQIIRLQSRLNSSYQQKHDDDHEQEAEATTRVISPAGAIRPGRQCADEYEDQDDEQDRAKHCDTGAGSCSCTNVQRQKQVPRVKTSYC